MNRLRPFGLADVFAPTGAEARAFDHRVTRQHGFSADTLMEAAGRAAASLVQEMFPEGRVHVLAGSGNNGGDAVVAARTLAAWGRAVNLIPIASKPRAELYHGWRLPADPDLPFHQHDVVVDGMLGTGLRDAPRKALQGWIERVNASGAPVVALDVPSGIDADTGRVPGAAIAARVTAAFGWPKLGCLLYPARRYAGRIVAVEIGFPPPAASFSARLITPGWFDRERPRREAATHKNQVGAVLVVAGRSGMAGAAIIAARAALRAGAGQVRIASIDVNRTILQEAVPEAVYVDAADSEAMAAALAASHAAVVGPGLGTDAWAAGVLRSVLEANAALPLVLDADALNLLAAGNPDTVADAIAGRPSLLTPHPGEMRRLMGMPPQLAPSPDDARDLAKRTGAVVLLKGTPSVAAAPEGALLVGTQGSSDLAAAGMGDLLAGAAAALLAQVKQPALAAGLALHLTGRAASLASRGESLIPQDVVERMPDVWYEIGAGHTDLLTPGVIFDQDPPR